MAGHPVPQLSQVGEHREGQSASQLANLHAKWRLATKAGTWSARNSIKMLYREDVVVSSAFLHRLTIEVFWQQNIPKLN